jgi:glutamine synthetase
MMDLEQVRKYISENNIHTVEVGLADINGVLRGKRLPARHFLKIAETGTAMAKAPFVWDIQCGVYDDTEVANTDNGFPDMAARPDLSTFRQIPWRPGSAFVFGDVYDEQGHPLEVSPRKVLQRVIERAASHGFRPLVGSELEFYLLDAGRQPLFKGIQCYSLYKGAELEYVVEEMRTGLENFGIELEAFHIEYGPAQIEVIPEYCDALRMADNTVLIKNGIKEIARKHGLYATFMAKPWAEESGNGYHVHQSLWSPDLKSNLFSTDSQLAEKYLAGLVRTSQEFMAFGSPSINSYKRFRENSFAPTRVTWGRDNRTVSTRSLGVGGASRFEHRTGSADANPYIIIAANIAAGLYGIENNLTPPEVTRENAYLADAQRLPGTLRQALSYLEEGTVAREYLGEQFVRQFLTLGRHEVELYDLAVTDWEHNRYLEMA